MRITTLPEARREEAFALTVARVPQMTRTDAAWQFESPDSWTSHVALAALDGDDRLLGWGWSAHGTFNADDWWSCDVVVAREHEAAGVGSALFAAVLDGLPVEAAVLRASTYDDDPRAFEVARHWGFEVRTHSINSRLPLGDDLPDAVPPPGVTLESTETMRFPDEGAVEAMLARSQTHPEALAGQVYSGLEAFRAMVFPDERVIGVLARVDGQPAALLFGGVLKGQLYLAWTGVDPVHRGRGLARLMKQRAHLDGRAVGATSSYTNNEERNEPIRRLNAALGYVVESGTYRLAKQL